jgi:hypothetical protein
MVTGMLIGRLVFTHPGKVGKHARRRLNATHTRTRPAGGVDAQWVLDLNRMRRELIADPRSSLSDTAATGEVPELLSGDEPELLAGYKEPVSSHG